MALRNCKECGKEISSKAKKCPSCGADQRNWFMKHKIISFVLALVVLGGIGSAMGGGESNTATVNNKSNTASKQPVAKVGDVIKTDKLEIVITSIKEVAQVGSDGFEAKPSQGGTYVAVQWQYKNISKEPIGSFSTPTLHLVDKSGTKYDSDIDATSSLATEIKLDSKIMSDLNPGITVKDAEVFEISKEAFKAGGWKISIDADKDIDVNIK